MNVLIAEDDALTRLMLQRAVEHQGHACLVAQDGLEAWQLFQAHIVDVVISDWLMPLMDGVELCRRVRQQGDRAGGYTYVIFLTALDDSAGRSSTCTAAPSQPTSRLNGGTRFVLTLPTGHGETLRPS
jgi:DNA-binding response OmpR family regulator